LTNLINQAPEDLAERIAVYREAHAAAGHDPRKQHVTVLLHTFVGPDYETVREIARGPFCKYLSSSVELFQKTADSQGMATDFRRLSEDDREMLLSRAYLKYLDGRALIGTPDTCRATVDRLAAAGVDEIACFIDFGVPAEQVLAHLPYIAAVKAS